MENNKPGLEKLRRDMSMNADEPAGGAPDKLSTAGREAFAAGERREALAAEAERQAKGDDPEPSPGRLEAERGGGDEGSAAVTASSGAVYTAKHLFNVSPALYAKHRWEFWVVRICFVVVALLVCDCLACMSLKYYINQGLFIIPEALASIYTLVFLLAVLNAMWCLFVQAHIFVVCIIIAIMGIFALIGIKFSYYHCILMTICTLSGVSTWRIQKNLKGKSNAESKEHDVELHGSGVAEDLNHSSRNNAFSEAGAAPLAAPAASLGGDPQEKPREEPRTANLAAWPSPGLVAVVIAGVIMMGFYYYQQNQRLEGRAALATAAGVKTFNLQDGISISLPKSWEVSTTENSSDLLRAVRYDDQGVEVAGLNISSEEIYNLELLKNLNAQEQNEFAEAMVEVYRSLKFDSRLNMSDGQVTDYKIININHCCPAKG